MLIAFSAAAFAQNAASVQCRKTETQAECHTRLKCKPNEELEACQKRLLEAGEARDAEQSGGERRDRDDSNQDRGDRDDRGGRDDRDDRGNDDRDNGRDDGGDRGESRRQRGDRGRRGERRGGGGGGRGFQANKTFGLGLEVGEPTGLNGKFFVGESMALDFGVGWIYRHYYYEDGLHLYGDLLFHPVSLVSSPALELPFYIGVGLRYWDFDYCYMGLCEYGTSAIGIRVPLGISFDFNNVPLDIFLQLVPVIDVLRGDYYDRYRDRAHFGVDLSAGIRFWFK